jgi:hypothetical protein
LVRYIEENEEEDLTLQEPPPRAHLALLVEERISHTFPLRGEIQLGREKNNAIVVADKKVSRHHALLTPLDKAFIISDQGSANGTYVNGVLIAQPTRLQNNDKISIGDATFLFTTGQSAPQTFDQPLSPPATPLPPQAAAPSSIPVMVTDNRIIWIVIGCMALAIIILSIILALILGVFVGRGQLGLALFWLAQGGWF